MLVLGIGIGLFYSSITTASVTALDPARAGLAGGIVYMFQIAGGSVGLGLNTTIFTSSSKGDLNSQLNQVGAAVSERQADLVHGILAGTASGKEVLAQFSASVAARLSSLVRDAFVAGPAHGFPDRHRLRAVRAARRCAVRRRATAHAVGLALESRACDQAPRSC